MHLRTALWATLLFFLAGLLQASGEDANSVRSNSAGAVESHHSEYYWKSITAGNSAQLLTLFCSACAEDKSGEDVPLVSVLRDTLGDSDPENDRLTYVWLLSYTPQSVAQRALAAVPFFYWRVGGGGVASTKGDVKPLLNLATPAHPVILGAARTMLQWAVLDPMIMPVRASSRAYQTNETNQERVHLQEAIGYLQLAPVGNDSAELTPSEMNTLIARLELRKKLLGGLVNGQRAQRVGEEAAMDQERIRSRNWELLRECAEKTGLLFQSLTVAGISGQYGILWFPVEGDSPPSPGTSLEPVWKLLNLKNPWTDKRLKEWSGPSLVRALDDNSSLQAEDTAGARRVQLIPLAVYSLSYPRMPLLLIDFRDRLHIRRHEVAQRSINEITSGIIGISHFTNWYYYVGADLYDFVVSRHGTAMDKASRLDCYSEFGAALALDNTLDPVLRSEMTKRIKSVSMNPLEDLGDQKMQAAFVNYRRLEAEAASGGALEHRVDVDRRQEVASFSGTGSARALHAIVHNVSLGLYTQRVSSKSDYLGALDRSRRASANLAFLQSVVEPGTQPEIAYDVTRIAASVNELSSLLPNLESTTIRSRAAQLLDRLKSLTRDDSLQADCAFAIQTAKPGLGGLRAGAATGIVANSRGASSIKLMDAVK